MFERRPGVEAAPGVTYEVPRLGKVPIADYGCALAHRRTWQAVADGPHESIFHYPRLRDAGRWVVVLEDDAPPVSRELLTEFPQVPAACDYVQLYTKSSFAFRALCQQTGVKRIRKGFGLFGYLLNRAGARRLLEASQDGCVQAKNFCLASRGAASMCRRTCLSWSGTCRALRG